MAPQPLVICRIQAAKTDFDARRQRSLHCHGEQSSSQRQKQACRASCVNIMCVNNTAKVSSPCRISGLLSKPPIFSPKICQSQRSRNMRIHSSQDCLRKVFSMASGLPQLSATASSKLQLRGGAKMWHSTCPRFTKQANKMVLWFPFLKNDALGIFNFFVLEISFSFWKYFGQNFAIDASVTSFDKRI